MLKQEQIHAAVLAVCKKNGIPADKEVAKAMVESIKMRDASAEEKIDSEGKIDYAQTMDNFQRYLTPSLQEKFFQILDEAIAKSTKAIDERAEKLNSDKAYHKSPHPEELVSDTKRVVKKTTFKNPTLGKLAELASACHDIVQEDGAPIMNEIKSKDKYIEYASTAINIFLAEQKDAPNFQNLQSAAEALKKQLNFIGNEIIVNGTYLVITNNFQTRKPLLHYVTEVDKLLAGVEKTEDIAEKYTNKLMAPNRDLYAAATIVSLYDTSRTLDREVGEMQTIKKMLANLPAENQQVFSKLFHKLESNDPAEQELILARLTQNLRMLVETNKFLKGRNDANEMTGDEVKNFVALFKASFREKTNPDAFLEQCTNSNLRDVLEKFNGRTAGEIVFARSLDFADHQTLAATYGQGHIFAKLDPDGWKKHADNLGKEKFQDWHKNLSSEEKEVAAETFLLLASIGQPGLAMMKEREPLKTNHAEFDKIVTISETEQQANVPMFAVSSTSSKL